MYVQPLPPATSVAAGAGTSTGKIVAIVVGVIVVGVLALGAVGIALGVGLGVGLRNKGSSDSSATSGTTVSGQTTAVATVTVSPSCTCGCSTVSIGSVLSRIINGVTATANSWPWMVYVSINSKTACGGFLIDYQHVVTAAHCVPNPTTDSVYVYAGLQRLSSATSDNRRFVSAIRSHPNYNSVTFDNDIAVLKLASSFTPSAKIGTCCLPTGTTSLPTIGEKAMIMGWGRTVDSATNTGSDELLQAVVQIQDTSETCKVSSIKFCAGLGTTDSCQGDSGGPLLTNVNSQWTCTGVVSSGVGCKGYGSYTRVSAFRSFIDSAVQTL